MRPCLARRKIKHTRRVGVDASPLSVVPQPPRPSASGHTTCKGRRRLADTAAAIAEAAAAASLPAAGLAGAGASPETATFRCLARRTHGVAVTDPFERRKESRSRVAGGGSRRNTRTGHRRAGRVTILQGALHASAILRVCVHLGI